MTNLKRFFVLAAALFLALGPVGGGTASAQDGEIVGIRVQHPNYPGPCQVPNPLRPCSTPTTPFTRLKVVHEIGAAEGVTVNSTTDTVRLAPGKYWFGDISPALGRQYVTSGFNHVHRLIREVSAITGQDSTGTTLKMKFGRYSGEWGTLIVVDGTGATSDDVKLGTVGRRVDFYCCNGATRESTHHEFFIRRLGD